MDDNATDNAQSQVQLFHCHFWQDDSSAVGLRRWVTVDDYAAQFLTAFQAEDLANRTDSMITVVVRVYLSIEQKKLLEIMCKTLGMGESEALREAFMYYAKSISLITKKVRGKI